MISFSRKSFTKSIFIFILVILLFSGITFLSVNRYLGREKDKFLSLLNKRIEQTLSVSAIHYSFPNRIITKKVSFVTGQEEEILLTDKVEIEFSLWDFLFKRGFKVKSISLKDADLDYSQIRSYLEDDFIDVVAFISNLNQGQTFKFNLERGDLYIPAIDNPKFKLRLNTSLQIVKDKVISSGGFTVNAVSKMMSIKDKSLEEPFEYRLLADIHKKGLKIESLEIKRDRFYGKFWGYFKPYLLKMYGFSYLKQRYERIVKKENIIKAIYSKAKEYFFRHRRKDIIGTEYLSFSVSDIDCLIKFYPGYINIEDVSFLLKGTPLNLKGVIEAGQESFVDLTFSSLSKDNRSFGTNKNKKTDLKINGRIKDGLFDGSLIFNTVKDNPRRFLEEIKTDFNNLSLNVVGLSGAEIGCQKVNFSYFKKGYSAELVFEDFLTDVYKRGDKLYLDLNSGIYNGILEGKGEVSISELPVKVDLDLVIEGAQANKFKEVSEYLSKIYGNLTAKIDYKNFPESVFKAKVDISDGLIDNMIFFKWVSDFFSIPSLKKVGFDNLFVDILLNDQGCYLQEINLDSRGVRVDGYFNLSNDDLVSSKISLALSKYLLETSPKFKSIVGYLEDSAFVVFDFRLSGLFNAMNFQWLDSEFKQEIRRRIPDFIERGIEKKIEKAIEALSLTNQ